MAKLLTSLHKRWPCKPALAAARLGSLAGERGLKSTTQQVPQPLTKGQQAGSVQVIRLPDRTSCYPPLIFFRPKIRLARTLQAKAPNCLSVCSY